MGVVVRVLMLGIGGDALVTLRLLKIDGSAGVGWRSLGGLVMLPSCSFLSRWEHQIPFCTPENHFPAPINFEKIRTKRLDHVIAGHYPQSNPPCYCGSPHIIAKGLDTRSGRV